MKIDVYGIKCDGYTEKLYTKCFYTSAKRIGKASNFLVEFGNFVLYNATPVRNIQGKKSLKVKIKSVIFYASSSSDNNFLGDEKKENKRDLNFRNKVSYNFRGTKIINST